jgi:hypothetical protein
MIAAGLNIYCDGMTTAEKEAPIEWLDGVSARRLLETIGTEWGRDTVCSDLWVRVMARKLFLAEKLHQKIVIDDVRYINERDLIRSFGGRLYFIGRDDLAQLSAGGHASEQQYEKLGADQVHIMRHEPSDRKRTVLLDQLATTLVASCQPTKLS